MSVIVSVLRIYVPLSDSVRNNSFLKIWSEFVEVWWMRQCMLEVVVTI